MDAKFKAMTSLLEFTPLEFETRSKTFKPHLFARLEFTPLEFETSTFLVDF